jgi:hypothetical protein
MLDIHPSIFMVEWFYTLFSRQFNLEMLFGIWDMLFLRGEVVLFRIVILAFDRTDFRNKQPQEILNTLKRLDKLLGPNLIKELDSSVLTEDDYFKLLSEFETKKSN